MKINLISPVKFDGTDNSRINFGKKEEYFIKSEDNEGDSFESAKEKKSALKSIGTFFKKADDIFMKGIQLYVDAVGFVLFGPDEDAKPTENLYEKAHMFDNSAAAVETEEMEEIERMSEAIIAQTEAFLKEPDVVVDPVKVPEDLLNEGREQESVKEPVVEVDKNDKAVVLEEEAAASDEDGEVSEETAADEDTDIVSEDKADADKVEAETVLEDLGEQAEEIAEDIEEGPVVIKMDENDSPAFVVSSILPEFQDDFDDEVDDEFFTPGS